MSRTVARNTREYRAVLTGGDRYVAYSLYHNFVGQPLDRDRARVEMIEKAGRDKLRAISDKPGWYRLSQHSNSWVEIYAPKAAAAAKARSGKAKKRKPAVDATSRLGAYTPTKSHVTLQGVGRVPAKAAGNLQPGDIVVRNYGHEYVVGAVQPVSPATVEVTLIGRDSGEVFAPQKLRGTTPQAVSGVEVEWSLGRRSNPRKGGRSNLGYSGPHKRRRGHRFNPPSAMAGLLAQLKAVGARKLATPKGYALRVKAPDRSTSVAVRRVLRDAGVPDGAVQDTLRKGGIIYDVLDSSQWWRHNPAKRRANSARFDVGETVTLLAPHIGVPEAVMYRGTVGADAVVMLNGMQMTVPRAWLSPRAAPARRSR